VRLHECQHFLTNQHVYQHHNTITLGGVVA
jgi:hypothetical protein